jgi:hypothetical protein
MGWGKKLLGFSLSLVFLWLALRRVEWRELPAIFRTIRLELLLPILASILVDHITRAFRWGIILGKEGIPFFNLYAGLILGNLFNNLFPARAGEVVRAMYLGRKGLARTSEAFGSVVMERFLDGIVIMTFISLTIHWFPVSDTIRKAGYSAITFYLTVLVGILVLHFRRRWVKFLLQPVLQRLPTSWAEKATGLLETFSRGFSTLDHPRSLVASIVGSYLSWGLSLLTIWLALQAFSLPFGIRETVLLITVLSLGAMIPSSPGMIGIYEFCCMIVLADLLGQRQELAAAFGLFLHSFSYLVVLLLGIGVLVWENLSLKELAVEGAPETKAVPAEPRA